MVIVTSFRKPLLRSFVLLGLALVGCRQELTSDIGEHTSNQSSLHGALTETELAKTVVPGMGRNVVVECLGNPSYEWQIDNGYIRMGYLRPVLSTKEEGVCLYSGFVIILTNDVVVKYSLILGAD